MKKIFKLTDEKKHEDRVLDGIKNDIRKYVKREKGNVKIKCNKVSIHVLRFTQPPCRRARRARFQFLRKAT